jgi:2-polyprenyl-3-methyl-5-hydroxy-6-metoxy-1,4-benzoquinol methylase
VTFNAHQQARYQVVLDAIGDIRGKSVVDLGCGEGAFTSLLVRKGAVVTGIDGEPEGIRLAKEIFVKEGLQANLVVGSVEKIDLPDASADAVTSCDVIEHLDDWTSHVAEAARILKPGGVLAVTTPYRICETPAPFHTHEFVPSELLSLAKPHFAQTSVRETHHLFWYTFFCYRPKLLRGIHLGRIFINAMTLWLGINPFMRDGSTRKKRDYFGQITLIARKAG